MYSRLIQYATIMVISFVGWSFALPTLKGGDQTRPLLKRAKAVFEWDDNRLNAKEQREKAEEAWLGMIILANMVFDKNRDANRWPRIFKHYFNDQDQTKVDKVFSMLVGEGEEEDPNGGAAFMSDIIITNTPVPKHEEACESGTVAHTTKINITPPKFVIRLCDVAYKYPLYTKTGCDKLGDTTSGWMSTLDGVILHEMIHVETLGIPATGRYIEDYGKAGYGPMNTRSFKENPVNDPTNNADQYRWYAQELFWTELCDKEFKDATANEDYPELEPPANYSPPPPLPPAAKTNALSIIFQKSLDEVGEGYDWLFLPGKKGEAMLCHDQKDGWHFTAKVGMNKNGIPPWPAGTFHFENLFGRICDYKNDGKDNPGMLWCKDKDGQNLKDVGIQCYSDDMRTTKTTKQCTKSGLIPSLEHVAVAYCEW